MGGCEAVMERDLIASHWPQDLRSAFIEPPKPLDFVLPGLPVGCVGALVSPGGVGKSMLALQLAMQISGGPDWLELGNLGRGSVLYLPAEDPWPVLHHRLFTLGQYIDARQRVALERDLRLIPLQGANPNVLDSHWWKAIALWAEGVRLVVIDTLRRFHDADENAACAMTQVLGQLERLAMGLGCAVLFVHHTSKSAAFQEAGDLQQASRGSSVLVDNVRWQGYLATMTKREAQQLGVSEGLCHRYVRFGVSKSNYGPPLPERWLVRDESGVLRSVTLGDVRRERGKRVLL
ncbi:MAG: helicase RepA family protein [Aeromonas popoffii]|uniref:helicase RepA family protein n=1 Tax=Aeromonas popoffii TaxID=70856 RepID=UPI003F34645B